VLIFDFARRARPDHSRDHSRAWRIITPASARPWERLALIKARGSAAVASWLTNSSDNISLSFIREPDTRFARRDRHIKRRIERDVVGPDKLERDVKLGSGGIREIEFVVQAFNSSTARITIPAESSTFKALGALRRLDLLRPMKCWRSTKPTGFSGALSIVCKSSRTADHTIPRDRVALRATPLSLRFSSEEDFARLLRENMRARSLHFSTGCAAAIVAAFRGAAAKSTALAARFVAEKRQINLGWSRASEITR